MGWGGANNPSEVQQQLCCRRHPATWLHMEKFWKNGSRSLLPKKTNPMGEPTKIVGNGREASSGGIMLPSLVQSWKNFPHACGRVEKRCVQAVRTWNFLMKNNFQVFSQCDKKNDRFDCTKYHLLNFELAHAVRQNDTFKMPSQHEKCKKHWVLSIPPCEWRKKHVDSSRAASHPIPSFYFHSHTYLSPPFSTISISGQNKLTTNPQKC